MTRPWTPYTDKREAVGGTATYGERPGGDKPTAALYPTKARIALLREVAARQVVYTAADKTYWLENGPRCEPVRVNARVREQMAAGWLAHGPLISHAGKSCLIALTEAGREVLDTHGGAA